MAKIPRLCLLCTPENPDSPLTGALLLQVLNNTGFDIWFNIAMSNGTDWAIPLTQDSYAVNTGKIVELIRTSIKEIQEDTTLIFTIKTITDKGDITNTQKIILRPKSLIKTGGYNSIEGLPVGNRTKVYELPYSIKHNESGITASNSEQIRNNKVIQTTKTKPSTQWETAKIDLHWNKIDIDDKHLYITPHEILSCQLRYFERKLNQELKKRTYELEINVGRSGGKLKSEVVNILKSRGLKYQYRIDNEPSVLLTTLRTKI